MKYAHWLNMAMEEAPEGGPARASLVIAEAVWRVYVQHDRDRREARELAGVDVELPMRDQDWVALGWILSTLGDNTPPLAPIRVQRGGNDESLS